jgi:hypothetical protein
MAIMVISIVLIVAALGVVLGFGADSRDGGRWYPGLDDLDLTRR